MDKIIFEQDADPNFVRHVSLVPLIVQALIGAITEHLIAVNFTATEKLVTLHFLFSDVVPLDLAIVEEAVAELEAQLGSFTPEVTSTVTQGDRENEWPGRDGYRVIQRYDGFLDGTF